VLDIGASNVELVRRLQPGPDVNLAAMFRDDDAFRNLAEAMGSFFHPEFEGVMAVGGATQASYVGLDGLRAIWIDWLAPWATYRVEIEEIVDAGERVVVLVRDFGRRDESTLEVELITAAMWTVRDGKIARAEFYPDRPSALAAAGLEG
jgi:ketosteroid isomerase-like protein